MSYQVLESINLLGDRIVVRELVDSPIWMKRRRKGIARGIVVNVGTGWYTKRKKTLMPHAVKRGDTIIFSREAGEPFAIPQANDELRVLRENDVLGIVTEGEYDRSNCE